MEPMVSETEKHIKSLFNNFKVSDHHVVIHKNTSLIIIWEF